MADKHVVRFEPVGIEIEVAEEQTILRAAAEQGIMLMHGCKEGQCASCKSFVLDGEDIEHDRYSTFALPDYELEEGYTLLCRAHAYEDLTIELLNYDEEMIRSGLPIQQGVAEVVANDPVTHDMRHLVLRLIEPAEIKFFPGQYMDIAVPGTDAVRSFSMANTSSRESGQLEFVIKVYPDGLFSQFLDQTAPGRRPAGPDRAVRGLHPPRSEADLVFVGGGAGMAPILSLLRSMAERGLQRKATFFYGARARGTCASSRSCGSWRRSCPASAISRPVRGGRDDGLGRRDRPDHRRGQAACGDLTRSARLRLRSAADGGGGPAAAEPPSASKRSASITTSSPPPATRRTMSAKEGTS